MSVEKSPSSPVDPVFTAQQDGKLPNHSTPFHLARRVSDIGALAQGGSDITPTAESAKHARVDYGRRESASSQENQIHRDVEGKKTIPDSDHKGSHFFVNPLSELNTEFKGLLSNKTLSKSTNKDGVNRTIDENKEKKSHTISDADELNPLETTLDHNTESKIPDNGISQKESHTSATAATPKDLINSFHLPKRLPPLTSLEGLVENELKNIFVHDQQDDDNPLNSIRKPLGDNSEDVSLLKSKPNSNVKQTTDLHNTLPNPAKSSSSLIEKAAYSSQSSTDTSTFTTTANSEDSTGPHPLVHRYSWVPPGSGNPSKDNDIEDARARWFSYENFKDMMYTKLHNGTSSSSTDGKSNHI